MIQLASARKSIKGLKKRTLQVRVDFMREMESVNIRT